LSVKLDAAAPDGFLTHSFSGDDPIACRDHVRNKCGLPEFKPNGGRRPRRSSDEVAQLLRAAVRSQQEKPQGRLVATYQYTDKDGALLYEVLRYEPKTFRQRRPDGTGGWIWKLDERRVLYRLQELLSYPDATVFVCEGEKDADRIADFGQCATTVASGKWTDECLKPLAGRDVVILEDNDEAGRKKALEAATLLHGIVSTVRVVQLPGLSDGGDVSDWLDSGRGADQLVEQCFAVPVWVPSPPSAPRDLENSESSAKKETSGTKTSSEKFELPPLPFINVTGWQDQAVPEREWCVLNRIPMRNVTLFSGEGAIGKSIVSLQLSVANVLGNDWLGALPEPGPVIVIACEDERDELHRRLSMILDHYGATFSDLGDLHPLSMAGEDALLAAPDRNGLMQPTKLFGQLHTAAREIRPKLIVLDNSADIFGGNENDRAQVRQFIGILRGLSISANAGILLTSHPSLTGMNTGTGLSGSTAWHASVRSRLYMKRAVTERDEEPDPELRVIEVMKSNYGPVGETITVRWKEGVFIPIAGLGTLDKLAAENNAEDRFLELLDRLTVQGRNVSHARTSNNYAPTVFASDPAAKGKRNELAAAMERLFAAGKIRAEKYNRQGSTRLVRRATHD
jgi:RecA-family ATPase